MGEGLPGLYLLGLWIRFKILDFFPKSCEKPWKVLSGGMLSWDESTYYVSLVVSSAYTIFWNSCTSREGQGDSPSSSLKEKTESQKCQATETRTSSESVVVAL